MKRTALLLLVLSILFLPFAAVHAALSRTLRLGMSGEDVRELQVFLNSDAATRIAASGVGSPGQETTYFGSLTFAAVKRLQEKYALEILTPLGLSYATGTVGPSTIGAIQRRQGASAGAALPAPSTAPAPQGVPVITGISPRIVTTLPATLTITGSNFGPSGNKVDISSESESAAGSFGSPDGKTLTIPFSYSGALKLRSQLAPLQGSSRYDDALDAVLENISGEAISRSGSRLYANVILTVSNAYGMSAPASFSVDIAALLK